MPKVVKFILFALLGLFVLVFIVPFVCGLLSTVNSKRSIELSRQKAAEDANVHVPSGYTLIKKADQKQSEEGVLFVTTMNNQKNTIQIIQSNKSEIACKGTQKAMGGKNVCFFGFGSVQTQPNKKLLMWNSGNSSFQLETDDKTISDDEISKVISGL